MPRVLWFTQPRWAALLVPLALAGCVTVDPKPDYQQTATIIERQTGQAETYRPDRDDAEIKAVVDAVLARGMSLDDAVRLAMLNNPRLQAIFHDVGISRAEVVQAGLLTNPSIAGSVRFPHGSGTLDVTVSAAQNLIELLLIPIRKKIANSALEQTQLAVAQQAIELIGDVKRSYYQLVALGRAEVITRENLDLAERSAGLAQRRLDAGEADRLDVNLARADALDVKRELLTIQRDRQIAEAAFMRLLGLSRAGADLKLTGDLPQPVDIAALNDLLERASKQRLEARVAELRIAEAEERLELERMSIITNLSVGIEHQTNLAPPSETGPTFDVAVPIWHQNQALIARSMLAVTREKRYQQAALDTIASDVQKASAAARANARLVQFYDEEGLPLSRANVESTTRAYQTGQHDIIRLTQAHRFLIEQRRAYVNVLRDYAVAIADLEQALGGRLDATTPAVKTEAK
jgi:cobalt-zinc-cadmium efflux system outer membrane protein